MSVLLMMAGCTSAGMATSGGGALPLEAQRLGLEAWASDLNPVAVMIGKAMIEIPPKFKDMPPIHPGIKERSFYRNAEGLAEDVKYYGEWMRENTSLIWSPIASSASRVAFSREAFSMRSSKVLPASRSAFSSSRYFPRLIFQS